MSNPNWLSVGAAACAIALMLSVPAAQAAQSPDGVWLNDTGEAAINLYDCGRQLCGKIVWLRQPISKTTGKPLRDARNPSPARRNRPICGLRIISGLRPQSDGSWDGGQIYDPKVGKTYNVAVTPLDSGRIRVTGYIGMRMLGKSFVWRRAPGSIDKC